MTPLSRGLCLGLVVATGAVVAAQNPPAAFRYERAVAPAGAGPNRLSVDVALLSGARPFDVEVRRLDSGERVAIASGGLADLRLFDASNRDVPYVLVPPPREDALWAAGRVLPTPATEDTSGFEADLGRVVTVDRIRVGGLPPPFMKRLTLDGSGDRRRWTTLVAEGTLFDLPDESIAQTELPFRPGDYRYLRVTWNDANSGRVRLPRSVEAREVVARAPAEPLTAPLAVEQRPSEPRFSRYRLRLPGARLPVVAIELDVADAHVLRPARITEARMTGTEVTPVLLGETTLRQVVTNGVVASSLRVPIESPTQAELDLVVDDGDNPSLTITSVTAVFAELPWIYFESDGRPLVARYGDVRLDRPRYDLEAMLGSIEGGVRPASWGEVLALEPEPAAASTGMLPTTGAPLDVAPFEYRREIPAGVGGLTAISLDAAVLAHSAGPRRGFADVRVVDDTGRQVPYLLERQAEPLSVDVRLDPLRGDEASPLEVRPGDSVYRVTLPYAGLPASQLVLATTERVFRRSVSLEVVRPAEGRRLEPDVGTVHTIEWLHAESDVPAPDLTLPVPDSAPDELFVRIREGDNSPLPLESARLLLPSHRLRFFRPPDARLRLVYGAPRQAPPSYDLVLLTPRLLGAAASEVTPGAEQRLGPDAASGTALVRPAIFWAALILAVVVLVGIIVRLLLRQEPAG